MPNESYDWNAARERLHAEAEREHPPAWVAEAAGDEIVGMVVEVKQSVPTAYGPVPVVTLQGPEGGRRSVWLHHAVLRRAFVRSSVQLGEVVLIRYLGRVTPEGGGNSYADYRLAVDRPTPSGAPDWRAIAESHEDLEHLDETPPAPTGDEHELDTADFPPAPVADEDIPF